MVPNTPYQASLSVYAINLKQDLTLDKVMKSQKKSLLLSKKKFAFPKQYTPEFVLSPSEEKSINLTFIIILTKTKT